VTANSRALLVCKSVQRDLVKEISAVQLTQEIAVSLARTRRRSRTQTELRALRGLDWIVSVLRLTAGGMRRRYLLYFRGVG